MSGSTTNLDLIQQSQAQKEVTANNLFDAASPALFLGRRASTTSGLTWGFYGGAYENGATTSQLSNGTVNLTANTTNYVEFNPSTGLVTANTSGFTLGRRKMYQLVCGSATVSSYIDVRIQGGGGGAVVDYGITYSTTYKNASFGGYDNSVNMASNSLVLGGNTNTVNGNDSAILAGISNLSNGFRTLILGGSGNKTVGNDSIASGKQAESKRQSDYSRSSGQFNAKGDAQYTFNMLRCQTFSTSETELFIDGGSLQFSLTTGFRMAFDLLIIASDSSGLTSSWKVLGSIKNTSGTVSLVGTPTITNIGSDSGTSGWTLNVYADNTNKAFKITISGASGVKCVCHLRATELLI
jgi:hypothetical protein